MARNNSDAPDSSGRAAPAWHPGRYARRRANLARRAAAIRAIRRFFEEAGFAETDTPALQVSPGLEPHLKAFATDLERPDGSSRRLYLHTSPEFAMKKLLVAGEAKLFQLAPVFRNGERAATHHPAFTMLEWYRAGADYTAIMADCEALLRAVADATGRPRWRWQDREAEIAAPWQRISVAEAFHQYANLDLAACIGADPQAPDLVAMRRAAEGIGIRVDAGDSWDDLYFRIALEKVEPRLGHPAPTILYDYPIHMAALSRPKPGNARLAERFEVYVCGLELANAFSELTDAAEQERRFRADMALKKRLYGSDYPIDPDFIAALCFGLPDCAGIALGIDRLAMLLCHAAHIEDVLWLPVAE